jgi:hypothetical protein
VTAILAVDAGPTQSGWLTFEDGRHLSGSISPNAALASLVRELVRDDYIGAVVIETIEPWGGFTGPPALETMRWVGRFEEAADPLPVTLLKRSEILRRLGVGRIPAGQAKAAVRALLIERWGGGNPARRDHPLHGLTSHLWSALAIAVAFTDGQAAP